MLIKLRFFVVPKL